MQEKLEKNSYFEKAIEFEKIFHLCWQNSCFYSVASKQVEDFFQIFVAFSKKLDFKLKTNMYMLHWAQNFEWADTVRINGKRNSTVKLNTKEGESLWSDFFFSSHFILKHEHDHSSDIVNFNFSNFLPTIYHTALWTRVILERK